MKLPCKHGEKRSLCKECHRERGRANYKKKRAQTKKPYWYIYYLPHEHRIGHCNDLWARMRKLSYKYNTNDYKILQTASTKQEAIEYELMFGGTLALNGLY